MSAPGVNEIIAATEGFQSTTEQQYAVNGVHWQHVVAPAALPALARAFRDAGYVMEMLTCIDLVGTDKVFRLVQQFNLLNAGERHRVLADVPEGEDAPSVSGIYGSANWYEREVFDMYGLRFANHPNLERLLMPEGSTWHPLRKEFFDPSTMPPAEPAAGATNVNP